MGLVQSWRREATGGIIIDVPAGTTNESSASAAYREIRSLMAAAGVPPYAVVVRPYRPADSQKLATIKLIYPRMVAEAGPCGLWPEDLGPADDIKQHAENRPYYNLGCANQRNLAAMVDNPADLVQPRTESPTYTGRRTTAIDKYRQGQSPSTTYPDANKGTISDVGKN
jgi:pilus assembly protein CpaD